MFLGFCQLGDTLTRTLLTRTTAFLPTNASAAPVFRCYGISSTPLLTGSTSGFRDTGTITGATRANPCVITDATHGLKTGDRIYISGVSGMTELNGNYYTITRIDADSFSLDSTNSSAYTAYTSGGTWNVAGLYYFELACTAGNGFASGSTYSILWNYVVSTTQGQLMTFTVV